MSQHNIRQWFAAWSVPSRSDNVLSLLEALYLKEVSPKEMPNYVHIETASPEGTFCDTVQVPSRGGDMELI